MKKLFSTIIALVLGLVLSFSAFACKKHIEEPKPEPIVAVDGVNVQNVIDALGPINDSEYLTLNVDFAMAQASALTSQSSSNEMAFTAEIKLKKTIRGYDFIATVVPEMAGASSAQAMSIVCYYVDGRLVTAHKMAGQVIAVEENEDSKTFNGLLNDLNKEIAEDPEMREVYEQMLSITEEIKALFANGSMASLDESFDFDAKDSVNGAFNYLKTNAQKTVYEIIVTEAEITQTEDEVDQIVLGVVNEFCQDNPTLPTLIDRIVEVINADMDENSKINLREIFNAIEAEGLNAVALCDLVNQIAGDQVLTPPTTATSLYDYLIGLISGIHVNDLAVLLLENETATAADLATFILESARSLTIAGIFEQLFAVDLTALTMSCSALNAAAAIKTDNNSRLLSLSAEFAVGYNMTIGTESRAESLGASLEIGVSYAEFDTEMVIPEELIDMLEEQSKDE